MFLVLILSLYGIEKVQQKMKEGEKKQLALFGLALLLSVSITNLVVIQEKFHPYITIGIVILVFIYNHKYKKHPLS